MTKKERRNVLICLCTFIIVIIGACFISNQLLSLEPAEKTETIVETSEIKNKQLRIEHNYFDVEMLGYDNGHLYTTICLSDKGLLAMNSDLSEEKVTVSVGIYDNRIDEPYFVSEAHNKMEDLSYECVTDLMIDMNQLKDSGKLSDFNAQLAKIKQNKEHNVMYKIEIIAENNPNHYMKWIGMLHEMDNNVINTDENAYYHTGISTQN